MVIGVTAAESILGNEVITNLLQFTNKESIIAISDKSVGLENSTISTRLTDFENYLDIKKSLNNVDILVLISSHNDSSNIENQHKLIIKACEENNLKKIIFLSYIGNSIRKDDYSLLIKAFRETECLLKSQEIPFTVVRSNRLIEDVLEGLPKNDLNSMVSKIGSEGLCGYTSRGELSYVLAKKAFTKENLNRIYNVCGDKVSPQKLLNQINIIFKSNYQLNKVGNDYISNAIDRGDFEVSSDFYEISNKHHKSLLAMIKNYYEQHKIMFVSELENQ